MQLLILGIDRQHSARLDRIFLLKDRIVIIVEDRLTIRAHLLDPVFQINANAPRDTNSCQENRRDAVGAGNDRCDVDERHIRACLPTSP